MKTAISLILLKLALSGVLAAQTTTFTESTPKLCLFGLTCNGLPLDQGGAWQFVLSNSTFSISNSFFPGAFICGNPASASCPGGLQVTANTVQIPPYGTTGPEGEIDFNWTATDYYYPSLVYTGAAKVQAHYFKGCTRCLWLLKVDSAAIVVN
jgi:hypothetical protein